jgi:hypothetical protein
VSEYDDGWIVLVHPEDVNIADAKARAADYDATIEPNRFVRRGECILTRRSVLKIAERSQQGRGEDVQEETS